MSKHQAASSHLLRLEVVLRIRAEKGVSMIPTTDLSRRVAALCRRKPTTPWSPREVQVYKRLFKDGFFDNLDDLALIEQYYAFERKKPAEGPNRGCHRRGLFTFLNNAGEELDRANDWREKHPLKQAPRKIIPLPPVKDDSPPLILSADDEAQVSLFQQQFTAFKKVRAIMKGSGA